MNDQELNQLHAAASGYRCFSALAVLFLCLGTERDRAKAWTLNGCFDRQCKPIKPAAPD
jgi:hypothetical protein